MRVELFVRSYPPKRFIGGELYDHDLLRELRQRGHSVVVRTNHAQQWEWEGVPVNENSSSIPDVVICHTGSYGGGMLRANTVTPRPLTVGIVHSHASEVIQAARAVKYDLLVFNSLSTKTLVNGDDPIKGRTLILYPRTYEWNPYTHERTAVGFVNSDWAKGGARIRTLAESNPDLEFIGIAGGYGNSVNMRDLPNVTLLEHGSDMNQVWSKAGVFLVPSIAESWGMAAGEAMTAGIPVIYASNLAAVREQVGPAGKGVPADDIAAWTQAIRDMLAGGVPIGELQKRVVENHRRHKQSLEAFCQALEEMYHDR